MEDAKRMMIERQLDEARARLALADSLVRAHGGDPQMYAARRDPHVKNILDLQHALDLHVMSFLAPVSDTIQ
jgi:precorrin-4 methylase